MSSSLTVSEAAKRLNLSDSTIRNYLNASKLERKVIKGRHYVTIKSIKALENKKEKHEETNSDLWTRRAVLASFLSVGISLTMPWQTKIVADFLEDSYGTNGTEVDIKDLFDYWSDLNLSYGSAHPEHIKDFHPDIAEAQSNISRLMDPNGKIEFRPLIDCLKSSNDEAQILVGGPISNESSRKLHCHMVSNKKISIDPIKENNFRWQFHYPYGKDNDPKFSRFVNGVEVSTMPKAIIDRKANYGCRKINLPQIYPDTQRISTDYLLLTVIENKLNGYSTGNNLIDVADLNGQGIKAFAKIMSNKERRKELKKEISNKPHFQALYKVEVLHDDINKITSLGNITLQGVHSLS